MMPLVVPTIVGPLSELSQAVRVQGQLAGATVTIISLTPQRHDVAKGIAQSGDQSFPLLAGVQLSAQDRLVAIQELGGERSPDPAESLATHVQPKPQHASEIGRVGFVTHLYECGRHVFIDGAIPGATVELRASTGSLLGQGHAAEGNARFSLIAGGLLGASTVTARQIVPGLPAGPDTVRVPDALPVPPGAPLPAPVLHPPVHICDASLLVTSVIDGAKVTVLHKSGLSADVFGFDTAGAWGILRTPLQEGDALTVRQEVEPRCERMPSETTVTLAPLKPLGPPTVVPPLCVGTPFVQVTDCRPGALIKLSANGKTWKGEVPRDRIGLTFKIEPLTGGSVRATQTLCGVESDPSFPVPVNPHEDVKNPPSLIRPLYACARCVSVNNVHPGAMLQVWARNASGEGPISDFVSLLDPQGTIAVAPYLREGDDVFVIQWACAEKGKESAAERVQPIPPLPKPTAWRPISGAATIEIKDVVPGALVEVYASRGSPGWTFAGAAVADALTIPTRVTCTPPLKSGDFVRARQSLCGILTELGDPVQVVVPKPLAPDHLSPTPGATNIPVQPVLSWTDPGAMEERHATQYEVQVLLGNQTVVPMISVATTNLQLPVALQQNTTYVWQVRAANSNPYEKSEFASASFTTVKPAPALRPVIDIYEQITDILKAHGFAPNAQVTVRVVVEGNIANTIDHREGKRFIQADAQGAIHTPLNWVTFMPKLQLPAGSPYWGATIVLPYPGERVTIDAHDGRNDPNNPTAYLWSNAFSFTWQ